MKLTLTVIDRIRLEDLLNQQPGNIKSLASRTQDDIAERIALPDRSKFQVLQDGKYVADNDAAIKAEPDLVVELETAETRELVDLFDKWERFTGIERRTWVRRVYRQLSERKLKP